MQGNSRKIKSFNKCVDDAVLEVDGRVPVDSFNDELI